jgi:hypothetical protein
VSSSERDVTVSWNAVADAASYTVLKSTTTSTGTYSSKASGLTGTSWTSTALDANNYWFEVDAYLGTKWVSVPSSPSGETTIATSGTECKQP